LSYSISTSALESPDLLLSTLYDKILLHNTIILIITPKSWNPSLNLILLNTQYRYGTYLGQAFQLIDDALDFEDSSLLTGKAPLADLKSGLATAPALFAGKFI
tara:strand:+ start:422 stop:730 length:309 start_codon:yes stop_codon:yes gene_type:complete